MGLMGALRILSGRKGRRQALGAATAAIAAAALLFTTEIPSSLMSSVGGGSEALAELIARSPGARIGGTALKAKKPRLALSTPEKGPAAGAGTPEVPVADVLGGTTGPLGPAGSVFPPDFTSLVLPEFAPVGPGGIPGGGGSPGSGTPFFPPGGGGAVIVPGTPGGGGPGTPGGGGPDNPNPGNPNPPPPPVPAVPEPATWLMLIAGFGFIGYAMRTKRRVAFG